MNKIEVDGFFEDFEKLAEHARSVQYGDVENPADGVTYPDISIEVPEPVAREVAGKVSQLVGRKLRVNTIFFRRTCAETETAPHQAHTDSAMAEYTFIGYMQDGPEGTGTSLVRHKRHGFNSDPWTEGEFQAWKRDTNNYDAWEIEDLTQMKANRAAIYQSKMMHRAEPVGGFGDCNDNGRIVLVCFLERDV